MLQKGVSGEHGVVWLNNGGGDLWGWVDGETELGFLTVIDGKSLEKKGSESRSSSSTDGLEDQETLETGTIVREFSDSVKDIVNELFANSVVTSSIVVGSIFFTRNQLFWMEELFVRSRSY